MPAKSRAFIVSVSVPQWVLAWSAGCIVLTGCGVSGTTTISYTAGGQYSYLFENTDQPLRVAVLSLQMSGNVGERDGAYWADLVRTQIEDELKTAARKQGRKLVLVSPPQDADDIFEQEDRRRAGIVEPREPARSGQLTDRDVFVKGRLRISAENGWDWKWKYAPPTSAQRVLVPARDTSVNCALRVATDRGTTVTPFTSGLRPLRTAANPGGSLPSLDEDIALALKQVAPLFVRLFFVREIEEYVRVESSSSEECKQAVSILVNPARDDQAGVKEALSLLELAIRKHPDDHRAYFARGVALEKMGHLEEARDVYSKASQARGKEYDPSNPKHRQKMSKDPYYTAVARIEQRIADRELLRPGLGQATRPATESEDGDPKR